MTEENESKSLRVKGRNIRTDETGLICLTDLWTAAHGGANQKPADWWRLSSSKKLGNALLDRIMGKSHNSKNLPTKSIYYSRGSLGTYAHAILACAYAGYLDPALEVEIRETWLRYRAGDATLADEILTKASAEANLWVGTRALGRTARNQLTDTYQRHGVTDGQDFGRCTNETYLALFGLTAKQLKKKKEIKGPLRDAMGIGELTYVMASESLTTERIEELNSQGPTQCQIATRTSATFIREAIEKDRADRKRLKSA